MVFVEMEITWHTTASLTVSCGGASILFDPFLPLQGSGNDGLASKYRQAKSVFITHGHLDHLSDVPRLYEDLGVLVHCTLTPAKTLESLGFDMKKVVLAKPGDSFEDGAFRVAAKKGRHVSFDLRLVLETLLSPRMARFRSNAAMLFKLNKMFPEASETVAYEVEAASKTLLILGSLGLAGNEDYAETPDCLVLPYQGSSRLLGIASSIVERIKPKMVLLDHFDDSFPPISREVDVSPFIAHMRRIAPEVRVVAPKRSEAVSI
jgi:L-ascorbate metabolism protein UlaG (beta-lactamase superfamily)